MTARPDPDALLAQVQTEADAQTRGRLKIFLGYAAGVGKTYAMLEAARQRRAQGVDVVIGYVETHRRAETEALAAGLDVIPRRLVEYHGARLPELDLDAVLARQPQLVLVDELAHTNAPGSRHAKRYQDVEELLAAGRDVYTTLNIQHLESLNDVVAQITGVIVHETVPDRLLEAAAEIEVIDLPPDELILRLGEGKVYVPEQAARAVQHFFRKGNLTALRELALRRAAERVDDQMRAYMQTRAIAGPWSASERVLVSVGAGPLGERLVRAARRLATELNAEWFALNVETPGQRDLDRQSSAATLQLAEELGARAATVPGGDVVAAILTYARQHNITKIVIGQPLRSRWREWLAGSVVERLIRASGAIDVYVISGGPAAGADRPRPVRDWWPHRPLRRYAQSAAVITAATLIGFLIDPRLSAQKWALAVESFQAGQRVSGHLFSEPALDPTNLVMLYLAATMLSAIYLGRGPAILASGLSVLAFDFFFVAPFLTFSVTDVRYLLTFIGLFGVGVVVSSLAAQVREQAEAAQHRAAETAELYDLSRDLAAAAAPADIAGLVLRHIQQTFGREAIVLLRAGEKLAPQAASLQLDEGELAVADWVFRNGQPAGRNTQTLSAARLRYLPLMTQRGRLGVMGVKGPDDGRHLTPERRRLMEAFASQAAQAFERAQLAESARQAELLRASEQLQTALLNSVSHDLRTPLVSITGALSALEEDAPALDEAARRALVENARGEAERLNRLVGNLLDMSRLEAGALRLRCEPTDVGDLIGTALDQLGPRLGQRSVNVSLPPDLPLVPLDAAVMTRVLLNLLDNACKHAPGPTPIEVTAEAAGGWLRLRVADQGPGVAEADQPRLFDKFYRVQHPGQAAGTGLGLSICKGMVEAHGGAITVANAPAGGAVFTVSLPLEPA